MYCFKCYFSKLEHIAHYKEQNTVKTNFREHAPTHAQLQLRRRRRRRPVPNCPDGLCGRKAASKEAVEEEEVEEEVEEEEVEEEEEEEDGVIQRPFSGVILRRGRFIVNPKATDIKTQNINIHTLFINICTPRPSPLSLSVCLSVCLSLFWMSTLQLFTDVSNSLMKELFWWICT